MVTPTRSVRRVQRKRAAGKENSENVPKWFINYAKEKEEKEEKQFNVLKDIMEERNNTGKEMVNVLKSLLENTRK